MADLHAILKKKYKLPIPLQHVYRMVTDMIDAQMPVKTEGKISLSLMWISYIEFFAQRAKRATFERLPNVQDTFLAAGRKRKFSTRCAHDPETIWKGSTGACFRLSSVKKPHAR